MHVWVLEVFNRNDEYCDYDSEVVAVYSEENLDKAMEHFEKLCSFRIDDLDEDGEINRWENEDGYHFSSESEDEDVYIKYSYVGLKKREVI